MTNPNIEIVNDEEFAIDEGRLKRACEAVIAHEDADLESGVTIMIASNDEVQALNEQYRGISAPTDVLSFPSEGEDGGLDDEAPYLGDLIIAYPYASAQAERESLDLDDSLDLLVIHGVLHLLGYDHDTPENRAEMWVSQEAILTSLGLSTSLVPTLEETFHDE